MFRATEIAAKGYKMSVQISINGVIEDKYRSRILTKYNPALKSDREYRI